MSKKPLTALRSPPGQTDLVDSLVAPGQVGQAENTTTGNPPPNCTSTSNARHAGSAEASACPQRSEDSHSPLDGQSTHLTASAGVGQVEGTITDEQLCAWYETLTDEYLTHLYEKYGANTPRQAWAADKHGMRTLRCPVCDSSFVEEFCHEPPFVRFGCQHCGCGMDKEMNVISQRRLINVGISEVPKNAIVMGFFEQDDGFKYPFGYVRGEGYFMSDSDGWAMWNSPEGLASAMGNRLARYAA